MGVDFDITEKEGPKMNKWTTMDDVKKMKKIDPHKYTPFVAEALKNLRKEAGNKATVLGFVGLPYTLATYMVEGGSSKEYKEIKTLGYQAPAVLHAMLQNLADNVGQPLQTSIHFFSFLPPVLSSPTTNPNPPSIPPPSRLCDLPN
jgi:uroporphyrinogen decarboxylase